MNKLEGLTAEIVWPGEREFVAKVFCVDEMGLAWNESEKGPPVSITTTECTPRVHDQPPSIPGIRDDVLKLIPSDTDSVYEPSQSKLLCLAKERSVQIGHDLRPLTAVTMRHAAPPSYVKHSTKQLVRRSMYTMMNSYIGFDDRTSAKKSRDLTINNIKVPTLMNQWLATILVSNFRHILDFKITIR